MKIARDLFILVLLLGFMLQACARTPPPTEEAVDTSFSQGVFQATYQNTLFRTFEAARSTLQDQGLTITNSRRAADRGSLDAVMADGTMVNIAMRAQQPDLTDIAIKVGDYGSEEISREISRGIESRLRGSR
jgi:hypothetical protein